MTAWIGKKSQLIRQNLRRQPLKEMMEGREGRPAHAVVQLSARPLSMKSDVIRRGLLRSRVYQADRAGKREAGGCGRTRHLTKTPANPRKKLYTRNLSKDNARKRIQVREVIEVYQERAMQNKGREQRRLGK